MSPAESFEALSIKYRLEPEPVVTPQDIIREVASRDGLPVDVMMRIADAESNFNPNAKNPHSTATGIYQFLDGSWDYFNCPGSVVNARDNIECFATVMKREGYPAGLSHWNASKHNW